MVVLHYTAMTDCAAALRALCDPAREVSAHYLISAQGEVVQLVAEEMRAWHAGAGSWEGVCDVNSRSIGIELSNSGAVPFAAPQMTALEQLLGAVMGRWAIRPERVIGHSDCAPGRKIDPGARFDWLRLERQGLARPRGAGRVDQVDAARFRAAARAAGYSADVDDPTLLAAVRLRYHPTLSGPLDARDIAVLI